MSKRRKLSRALATATVAPSPVPAAYTDGDLTGNNSGRGYVIFPNQRSREHLRGTTRREAIRLSQWATLKIAAARYATRTLAQRAGVVTLAAATTDEKFNAAHREWWDNMYVKRSGNYDVTGKFTAEGFMENAMCGCFRDGDIGVAHVTGSDGEPLLMAVESTMIQTHYSRGNADGWVDGVQLDPRGRPLAFSICGNGLTDKPTIIPASSMALMANYETHDSVRGTPALFAVLDRIRDLREVDNAAIHAAKIQALIALYFKRELGAPETAIGSFGKTRMDNLAGQGTQTTAHYGAPSNIPQKVNEVFTDGGIFADLPPGTSPHILNDGKDYTAQTPLKEDIYKQIAWGAGVDPRALLSLDGMTGPDVRRILSDFQKWRERWQSQQLNVLTVDWLRRTEWGIRTGQIPRPKDGRWWIFNEQYPAAATIDAGRDAAANDKALANGTSNLRMLYGEMGLSWKPEAKQRLTELAFMKQEGAAMGLEPSEIFGKNAAPAAPASAAALSEEIGALRSSVELILQKMGIS